MDSCDESKDINARIVDMSSKTRLVPIYEILRLKINNFGKITLYINRHTLSSLKATG
jgi:hypothetical protein